MRKSFVRLFFSLLLIIPVFYTNSVSGKCPFIEYSTVSDTAGENQLLYNGRIWRNLYRRIEGDQFLNTDEFIPGTVIIGEKKYQNINLKYDIFNDEILTSSNKELLITLNKEMVDSFTIMYFNKVHHFKRLKEDSSKVVDGYVDVLYRGDISLYVKYMKKIDPVCAFKVYDNFFQIHRLYIDDSLSNGLNDHLATVHSGATLVPQGEIPGNGCILIDKGIHLLRAIDQGASGKAKNHNFPIVRTIAAGHDH